MDKHKLGPLGEKIAVKYLKKQGYKILARNFQNNYGKRLGEIDIVAEDKKEQEIIFVEVKTREYVKFRNTNPEENITVSKLKKLVKIAHYYLQIKHQEEVKYRFDAIAVWIDLQNKKAKIKHIPNL
jgi:putative endonuclease